MHCLRADGFVRVADGEAAPDRIGTTRVRDGASGTVDSPPPSKLLPES